MPLIKNSGRYGELGHWGKRPGRRFTKKKILLLGTLLSLSLIFAISHNGNIFPIVNAGDYNSSFSHTRTTIFQDNIFTGPVAGSLHFFDGPPAVGNGGIICGAGCAGPQTFTDTVTKGDALLVLLDINNTSCIGITDSQSNSYTQQACLGYGGGDTLQLSTTTASATGSDTVTVAATAQFYDGSLAGYSGITSITGIKAVASTTSANTGSDTLSPTGTITGIVFGHFALFRPSSGCNSASCPVPTGTLRARYTQSAGTIGSDDSTATSDTWSWTSTNCGNLGNPCLLGHVVIDLGFTTNPAANPNVRWNFNSTCVTVNSNIVFDFSLGTSGSGGNNCGSADIAITKSPFNLQTAAGRMLETVTAWQNNANTKTQNMTFVLRTNSSLPSFTENYNPVRDNQARLIWSLCPSYVCSGGTQTIYVVRDSTKSLNQEGLANDIVIQGPAPILNATNIPIGFQSVLNFTGPNNFINQYTASSTIATSNNTASSLQFGESYSIIVMSSFTGSPCGGCTTATIAFGPSGTVTVRSMGMWSVPASCNDPLNKAACGFGTATPVFQFNPLDPSSWGNAIIQGLLWVFTVAVPSGLKIVAAVLLQFLDVTFNFVGNQLGWGNIGDNIVTFINGLPSLFGQVGAVLGNLASIVSSVINTIIIANLLANPYFAGLVNILNDVKNILSAGLVINFLTEIAIWFPTSYMIILISTYFLFVLLKGLHGFFDWIHLVKWSSFQMVGLFSLFIYVFGKLITAMLGRMSIISPGHEFPHIPHPDPGELPKISLGGEVALFDDPTAWFLGFTGLIFTMMWAGTSAAGLPANTQTIIQSFNSLFLTLFGVGFMVLMLYIPGFLLGKLYQKGIIS